MSNRQVTPIWSDVTPGQGWGSLVLGSRRSLVPEAVLITLFIHGLLASALLAVDPDRHAVRILQPLEVTFLTPPQVLPPQPPPPPKPKAVVKPEIKPVAPPIQPVVLPDPDPVVSEEPPMPVAPPQEEPTPVEIPIILPEYNAEHLRSRNVAPYPAIAKRLHIEGTVIVRVLVSPLGLPQQIEVEQSSGAPVLDEAALKAVRNWAFVPARRGVEPVEAWIRFPIKYHLKQNG